MLLLETGFNTNLVGCCVANMTKEKVKLHMQYEAANKRKTQYTLQEDSTLINDVLLISQYPLSFSCRVVSDFNTFTVASLLPHL